MLLEFLRRLARRPQAAPAPAEEAPDVPEGPHMSRYTCHGGGPCKAVFLDPARGIRRTIVDETGRIRNFPGFDESDPHIRAAGTPRPAPRVVYMLQFARLPDGRHHVVWEIEPDGRYWADSDGFGMEDGEEVNLYTFLDSDGRFTGPFRVYSIGARRFYSSEE